jgi:hypothetical protein
MKKRVAIVAAVTVLTSSAPARGQEKLAFLIPNLYGPSGLFVDSQAPLPGGGTHSAHFNSAFQAEFTQFNISLASQIVSVPLPTPAAGFTFTLDPTLGVFTRTTQSFGSVLADRAETIGRRRVSVGVTFQRFTFDTLEGLGLDALPAVFTHDDAQLGGGRIDVVTTSNRIDLEVQQLTAAFNVGITDRLDLAVAVPILTVDLAVRSDATVRRLGTSSSPATHFYDDGRGGFGDTRQFVAQGSASGIGDLVLRLKWHAGKSGALDLALGVDGRIPTGDEENLLGSGAPGVKPFLTVSMSRKVSPHAGIGYQWNGDSVLAGNVITGEKGSFPDQILYNVGADVGVTPRFTLALDLVGRHVMDSPRLLDGTFRAQDGRSEFPDISFEQGSTFDLLDGAVGAKLNVGGQLLIDANVVFRLNDAGLRDRFTPLLGIEYTF